MFRSRSAAAADDPHAHVLDVIAQFLRELIRFHWINRFAVNIERQPGIGNTGDGQLRVRGQILDRLAHMLGSS